MYFSSESYLFESSSPLANLDSSHKASFSLLSEDSKIVVSDAILTEMFKFISDKYNSIDFSEIEKSMGDYRRFKYKTLLDSNIETLSNIYSSYAAEEPEVRKYQVLLDEMNVVEKFLVDRADDISYLYKKKNGVIQLSYISMVSSLIYGVSALITNTLRFITNNDGVIEATFDEIPSSIKNVHIKNIQNVSDNITTFDKLVTEYMKYEKGRLTESVGVFTTGVIGIGLFIFLIPKILVMIREIIYSVYYLRVSVSDALKLQSLLIKTNIESLEMNGGKKKVIASQKKIAMMLMSLSDKIAVKMDKTTTSVNREIREENKKLEIKSASSIDDAKHNEREYGVTETLPNSSEEYNLMV